MKKEEMGKEDIDRIKLIKGIVIGAAMVIIIGIVYFLMINDTSVEEDISLLGEKIYFNNSEVHQNVNNDFPGSAVPVYDSMYCEKKFEQIYGRDADECSIRAIRTFSRLNPLVTDVECVCSS